VGGIAGVVEDDKQPPGRGERLEPFGRRGERPRFGVPLAQRTQETAERGSRVHRREPGRGALQVDVELSAREPSGDLVREPDRQLRLAHAAGAVDRDDGRPVACGRSRQLAQDGELPGPAGERGDVGRELPRDR
jgi:hypothetical protein